MSALKAILLGAVALSSVDGATWSYTGLNDGASKWASLEGSAECAGRRQSPVDIESALVVNKPAEFAQLIAPVKAPSAQSLSHTGHGIKLDLSGREMSFVSSSQLYHSEAMQMHWHTPSEHTLDGKLYPAEVHMVTRSVDHELVGSTIGRVPYTVLGIWYEEGPEEDELLKMVLAANASLTSTGDMTTIMYNSLYDIETTFYEYPGSLTTPPCFETVHWMLSAVPRKATKAQLDLLFALMKESNRPVQPKNGRVVTKTQFLSNDMSMGYPGCEAGN